MFHLPINQDLKLEPIENRFVWYCALSIAHFSPDLYSESNEATNE